MVWCCQGTGESARKACMRGAKGCLCSDRPLWISQLITRSMSGCERGEDLGERANDGWVWRLMPTHACMHAMTSKADELG